MRCTYTGCLQTRCWLGRTSCRLRLRDDNRVPQLSESALQHLRCCLIDEELAAVNNTADPHLRRQKLLARGLTRSILPGYILGNCSSQVQHIVARHPDASHPTLADAVAGAAPQDLEFCRNLHGKPYISAKHFPGGRACDVDFNLTHTRSIVGVPLPKRLPGRLIAASRATFVQLRLLCLPTQSNNSRRCCPPSTCWGRCHNPIAGAASCTPQ
jgi:hypothetical protein